ncbi:phosphoenolpyruvate--protein phosphotransferase [Antrihabitans sp. YC2-6]|uniref:phosphoenolpyruvate--protein phosphotransferase n=1 Tax=Antrihabitans sp. YC2-6 TaxID=2799498 RepID=UPI0018F39293|nr:phosphoenolpyruvate--protein phosphotransferase [Antrihabitans sp. YC2-6]MBJ8345234.1 phosphoenolpyruvate--protein phosphotransferase [Antrihabitans sp. YC2-6]
MVGIVVVSHSRSLARAAVALAMEMVEAGSVRIEIASGLDESTFGTDAIAISDAIAAAADADGVVVLMDLGSAVLSAETALELLDDSLRDTVVLCAAPLVEGLVVATVVAAAGGSRAEVAAEATQALAGKQSHFEPPVAPNTALRDADEFARVFTVSNAHGLHARPAARVVAAVREFDARVELRNRTAQSPWVSASSLTRVATLDVLHGHEVEIRASGPQAREAVDGIVALAARSFDETEAPTAPLPVFDSAMPLPASPGIGIGAAWSAQAAPVDVTNAQSSGSDIEWRNIVEALSTVRRDLQRIRARTVRFAGEAEAAIFDAHRLLLDDSDLLDDVRARISRGQAAAQSWLAAITRVAREFDALHDPYLRERAADIRAVGDYVLRALPGIAAAATEGAGVLIGADITPAEAALLDPKRVKGVVLAHGSPTSHSAIIVRSLGIPAVVGLGPAILEVPHGTRIALDGATGEVAIDPSEEVLAHFRALAADLGRQERAVADRATASATTRDGVAITVAANVGSLADAKLAARSGADLVGLVRTELLFLGHRSPPSVDEQVTEYLAIADAFDGRRVTLRTLDAGGDKPLGFIPSPPDANPFLGVRGIRYALAHPEFLRDQLLAMVRVAHEVPVSVMFPMVTNVAEIRSARTFLDEAIERDGRGAPLGMKVGIMVEVPTTALKARALTPYVNFFSIGTNDLTQYATAAERGNPAVASIADGFDPGVLRLIDAVCRGAGERALVAVCGELAADPVAAVLLCGLGVRQLSMAPRSIASVKGAVRSVDTERGAVLAAAALDAEDAVAVRALLSE